VIAGTTRIPALCVRILVVPAIMSPGDGTPDGRRTGNTERMPLVRLGPLAVPTPIEVLTWTAAVVEVGARLPGRVEVLLDEVTRLLTTLDGIAERVDGLVDRADGIVVEIEGVITEARGITTGASSVVESARGITGGAAEVVESARSITSGADGVVTEARAITRGAASVVDDAGNITKGAASVVDDAAGITRGADGVVSEARTITRGASEVVESARTITTGADDVMTSAGSLSTHVQELLDLYRPMLERAAPLTKKFIDDLAPEEIDAAIQLVDELPALAHHMTTDILPILETLDRVGPDLHELLDVTKDLRRAIDGIPGFSFLKRRGDARADDRDGVDA
jgi:uncharacterized protein YoxC